MKKTYRTPAVHSGDEERNAFPVIALVAGYAAGRAVTNAMKVMALRGYRGIPTDRGNWS
ncbi:hypothetical protein [Sporomusa sp.]|uniref:hypothetical protein n=1 Tax=Sporomusa sp. TaxID=2078658 RepID=UPI002CF46EA0|nr:hypothetical protein [Sporomusa sp.]HWR05456.1 hypothetical protein [Sporomusa sp.]